VGRSKTRTGRVGTAAFAFLAIGTAMAISGEVAATSAAAAQSSVELGTTTPFAVLAGTTVTNTGPSVIFGDLGVSPGSAVTGFPPGRVNNGTQHVADAVALQAQSDLTTAYNDAAGRTPVTVESNPDLGGTTLAPGVYNVASAMSLTGTVTLDGQGDPNAVFIFQAGSTLITASSSTVKLIGGTQACNVFWQVGSSATLGTNTTFVGSILALTSATVQTGTTVAGRVLARNGQVSLDTNTISQPTCTTTTTTTTTAPTTTAPTTTTTTVLTTTTSPYPTTSSTMAAAIANSGSSSSSTASRVVTAAAGSLAFTGPGPGLTAMTLVGAALMLLGMVMLVLVDVPRRALRQLGYLSLGRWQGRVTGGSRRMAELMSQEAARSARWFLGR
jgi:hypothetical protein